MKKQSGSYFWPSYSDLMTSLFFIMLVMFVLTIVSLRNSLLEAERLRRISEEQLKSIQQIQEAVNQLPTDYFEEDVTNKRWVLKRSFSPKFNAADYNISQLNDTINLVKVGQSLMDVIDKLNRMKNDPRYKDMDITYLVVIEGMASRDTYFDNDALSYKRALSLYYLWRRNGISFEKSQCEVQISGSGVRGRGRFNADGLHPEEEVRNQRIMIQIVPKIGNLRKQNK
jgi:outer membrane protein OmpA-like peptidoglycan-associated protein